MLCFSPNNYESYEMINRFLQELAYEIKNFIILSKESSLLLWWNKKYYIYIKDNEKERDSRRVLFKYFLIVLTLWCLLWAFWLKLSTPKKKLINMNSFESPSKNVVKKQTINQNKCSNHFYYCELLFTTISLLCVLFCTFDLINHD